MLVKWRRGETEYGIGPIPLGGYVRITGMSPREEIPPEVLPRAYYNQPVGKRIAVILAGPVVNLVIAFVVLFGIFWADGVTPTTTVARALLVPPASHYLQPGDRIVGIDGRRNPSVDEVSNVIRSHRCPGELTAGCRASTPVTITVRRGQALQSFTVYPVYDAKDGFMRVGFGFRGVPMGPGTAATTSVSRMWYVTRVTVTTIARLFEPKVRSQLHGIVGGFRVTQERFAFSTTDALYTLALISLSLAVINLFPFLPLDGGHIFWAVAEKVRGGRISFDVLERAGFVGFALILVVFVIGLSNDISTLAGPGFAVR
jgi:regulator of sigma E protease